MRASTTVCKLGWGNWGGNCASACHHGNGCMHFWRRKRGGNINGMYHIRGQNVISTVCIRSKMHGELDPCVSHADAEHGSALSELREALRPDWQKRGLSMNIKRSVSIIKRTPSRSKTVKDLMASSAGAFASLKDLLEPPDSASGKPLRTASGASTGTASSFLDSEAAELQAAPGEPQAAAVAAAGDVGGASPLAGGGGAGGGGWSPVASRFLKPPAHLNEDVANEVSTAAGASGGGGGGGGRVAAAASPGVRAIL